MVFMISAKWKQMISLLRQQPVHRIKGYVRAADLVENEIEKQNLPTRFHFEARKGTFIKA